MKKPIVITGVSVNKPDPVVVANILRRQIRRESRPPSRDPARLKLTHHLSLLAQWGSLQMISLIPVDPTQEVQVVTLAVEELVKAFGALGARKRSKART